MCADRVFAVLKELWSFKCRFSSRCYDVLRLCATRILQ